MSDRVTLDVRDGIADVRLNRADKMNAIDADMFEALRDAGRAVAQDTSIRAAVLSGEGRAFCAGLDFSSFGAMAGGERRGGESAFREIDASGLSRDGANAAQLSAWTWQEVPVPVIAAVHGVAYGGGLQIALGADVRFVAPDARLSVREIHWGLVPDMSGTQALRRLVRLDVAKELSFTGRIVSGTEAVELGLATHVSDDPLASARALAGEIAARSPDAVRATKTLLNASGLLSQQEGLALEATLQKGLIGSANQVEAVRANLEKRAPDFADPKPE